MEQGLIPGTRCYMLEVAVSLFSAVRRELFCGPHIIPRFSQIT